VAAASSPNRDPIAVSKFIERFAEVHVAAGMPRIASRIFVALAVTDSGRLTAAELAELLQASPAAISGGVRYLEQLDLVRREREPGSRRDHYRVEDDLWYKSITGRERLMSRWTESLREGVDILGVDTPAGARLAESAEFFEFIEKEMKLLIEHWNNYRASRARPAG
jgi:DNA-binding transcriptional regulator GbsR (MarR family)